MSSRRSPWSSSFCRRRKSSSAATKVSATAAVSPLFAMDTGAAPNPIASSPVRCEPLTSGNNSAAGVPQTLGQFGHLSIGVSDEGRSLSREGVRHKLVFRRTGYPWVRDKLLEPKTRRGLHDPAARVELEQQRAGTVGRIERVLMQMRQHVGETRRPREQRYNGLAG